MTEIASNNLNIYPPEVSNNDNSSNNSANSEPENRLDQAANNFKNNLGLGSKVSNQLIYGILAVLAQLLILATLIFSQYMVLHTGTKIYLKLEPVDPRDLFRGDYLILNYKISNLKDRYIDNYSTYSKDVKVGDELYVSLYDIGGQKKDWSVSCLSREKGCGRSDDIFSSDRNIEIKGRVLSINKSLCDSSSYCDSSTYDVRLSYGIEEYFIEENSGRNLPSFDNAYGVVYVDKSGKAVLKDIEINGKKWP